MNYARKHKLLRSRRTQMHGCTSSTLNEVSNKRAQFTALIPVPDACRYIPNFAQQSERSCLLTLQVLQHQDEHRSFLISFPPWKKLVARDAALPRPRARGQRQSHQGPASVYCCLEWRSWRKEAGRRRREASLEVPPRRPEGLWRIWNTGRSGGRWGWALPRSWRLETTWRGQ